MLRKVLSIANIAVVVLLFSWQASCSGSSGSTTDTVTHGAHWSYSGEAGPDHWADLDPAYEQCGAGTSQSPVNLGGKFYGELPDFEIHYQPS
ncbi:MAG: hypothetical protein OEV92_13620, partial [Nitrospinota bacterium]|nr:hypothetical protein [Nitrospinota bacterium]